MNYNSTRNAALQVTAAQAIAQGISEEGGLFVPQSFPQVDVKAICALDYPEMAAAIVGQYLTDYSQEFLIHAVDVEGKQSGIDGELLELLAGSSPIPCVYAGGISSFEDVKRIEERGDGRIDYTVGSALDLFGGAMSYEELVAHRF